ncbi:Zinc finger C2H2-type [Arabidopsis suecica]|uniref:Zinc finger C2H2-type n=1 Tax=Arabidopsis suecica TaxID=45249 RepID=A0A8T2G4N7_ARASU|nr:Zinc finger C2H2-type [Arabidopsis suecica]
MERGRSDMEMINNMANCLILLSKAHQNDTKSRVFACKTCNKEFPSFQALGGHRASHRRSAALEGHAPPSPKRVKPVKHECPICGAEFAVGQALGGHMRKHRGGSGGGGVRSLAPATAPVTMKKSGGGNGKRVLCLDLNLTPLENEDLKLELGRFIF